MKTMTCKQLGGACDKKFQAETFDQMVAMCQQHGKEEADEGDKAHIEVMDKVRQDMAENPEAGQKMFEDTKKIFDDLPEDE